MLVDYLLPLVFIMLLVLVMLMLVFIMLISPFLWLVIPLPLPCLTSWNFIGVKMLFVTYSFNKKSYISCIFVVCPNLPFLFILILFILCIEDHVLIICLDLSMQGKIATFKGTLNYCIVLLKNILGLFYISISPSTSCYLLT